MDKTWKNLTQGQGEKEFLSLSFFPDKPFLLPLLVICIFIWWAILSSLLRTGNSNNWTQNKTTRNFQQGSVCSPYFVLLKLTTCISGGTETPAAGRSTGRHVLTGLMWQLAEGVCWSLTKYPLVKDLTTLISYEILFWKQNGSTPNWNPEAISLSHGFLLQVPWSPSPLQSQTGA